LRDSNAAAGVVLATPWGDASELRKRKLQPGAGTPRAEVVRNQRERLFGAIVAVVAEKGYEACTVADVLEVSGVSRSAFYEHFANKAECLVAAADALLELTLAELSEVPGDSGPEHARAIFERFVELVTEQPAAARACLVELRAAGEAGELSAARAFEAIVETVEQAWATPDGDQRIGPDLVRTLVGGLGKIVHTRIYRGEADELTSLAPDLWRWTTSVAPPPSPLDPPRRQRPPRVRFEGYTPGERIARAVASVLAEKGYGAMSTDDIAARAAISLSTFYDHFADKRDAVLGTLEMCGAQIMALAGPAARRAGNWQLGVRALYEAICAYLAAEPEMAKLATVGVYGAGAQALARRDRVIDSLAEMLAPGFTENPEAPAASAEAIGAAVYALIGRQVEETGAQSLAGVVPLATYITLVGFVGPERAYAVAKGDGGR
jgi:AcrR family transcriptional regulator